jgi:hypothetical protein
MWLFPTYVWMKINQITDASGQSAKTSAFSRHTMAVLAVGLSLGHNSKAVHHAYSKHAEVTAPSLDDWEREWGKDSQGSVQPRLLPVEFRSPLAAIAQSN